GLPGLPRDQHRADLLQGREQRELRRPGQLQVRLHGLRHAARDPEHGRVDHPGAAGRRQHRPDLRDARGPAPSRRGCRQVADLPTVGDLVRRRLDHVATDLQLSSAGLRIEHRPAERGHDRSRPGTRELAGATALEQPAPDGDHGLDADRLRHGGPLRRDQGDPRRDHRGRGDGRRLGVPGLPPDHGAEHPADDRRGHDLHGDQRAEGLRYRVRPPRQRRNKREGVGRGTDNPLVLPAQPQRPRGGDRGGAVRRGDPGDGVEHPPLPGRGGDPGSSATVEAPPKAPAHAPKRDQLEAAGRGGWFVRITIIVIVILWTIPTLGVLIPSLRPAEQVTASGWWTVFAHPFRATEWTIENYRIALDQGGFGNAFLNSLAVTIPSTVTPIRTPR